MSNKEEKNDGIYYHQCWSIGNNAYGQQGNGNNKIVPKLSMMRSLPKNIHINDIIHSANGSTYILCDNDQLFVFGDNNNKQLGIFNHVIRTISNNWCKYQIPNDIIILIVNFVDHSSNLPKLQTNPLLIKGSDIKFISYGILSFHKFILTKSNRLYGFGKNSQNQLSIKQDKNSWTICKNMEIVYFKQNKIELKKIVCGCNFSVFLTVNGNVFNCGYKEKKDIEIIKTFNENNDTIIDVTCGYNHCLALNEKKQLYSWGLNNQYGQLGNDQYPENKDYNIPKIIKYFINNKIKIDKIESGHSHNLCLDINGKVFIFVLTSWT